MPQNCAEVNLTVRSLCFNLDGRCVCGVLHWKWLLPGQVHNILRSFIFSRLLLNTPFNSEHQCRYFSGIFINASLEDAPLLLSFLPISGVPEPNLTRLCPGSNDATLGLILPRCTFPALSLQLLLTCQHHVAFWKSC